MRVAHFLGTMRPDHDGVTRVIYRMREEFRRGHLEHRFISPMLPDCPDQDMERVASIPLPVSSGYRLAVCTWRTLGRLLGNPPDLLHIHTPCTLGRAAVSYGQAMGIPVVFTYHTHFPSYLKYYRVELLRSFAWSYLRSLYGRAQANVVPSRAVAQELEQHGFPNLVSIPHGVDTERFSPAHRSGAFREAVGAGGRTIVTFVGRLVWEKNLMDVVKAARQVRSKDQIRFVVVGDGPARAKMQELMPDAHFTGFLSGEALSAAYASSDLFVFPSETETFGNVTIEAMASGLPAICASAGGAREIVSPGYNGLLVDPGDCGGLAEAIDRLVSQPALRRKMAIGAYRTSLQFRWETTVRRYEALYAEVVARRHAFSVPPGLHGAGVPVGRWPADPLSAGWGQVSAPHEPRIGT